MWFSFKPYYKWNTFNTDAMAKVLNNAMIVLNLIINGIPSIPLSSLYATHAARSGFKPYYKWNTFNTQLAESSRDDLAVLNLIINGIPSIHNWVE